MRVGPSIHGHAGVVDVAAGHILFFAEHCHKEATLVVIVRVESHAPGQVEWVAKHSSAFLVVMVSVVLMEHGLTQGVRLTFFTLPLWDTWPGLVPESRMILALASVEHFPLQKARTVA